VKGTVRVSRSRIAIILLAAIAASAAFWFALRPAAPPPMVPFPDTRPKPEVLLPPAHLTAAQDHARILKLLHLTALRPGVTPASANTDEMKANPWPDLPDPLKLANGTPVTTADMWWQQRRQEIADALEYEVYGRSYGAGPVAWQPDAGTPETIGGIAAVTRHLTAVVAGRSAIRATLKLTVTLPARAHRPVPVILLLSTDKAEADHPSTWRAQVLAKGWGAAMLDVTSVQADDGAGLTEGVIGVVSNGQPRELVDWGVLRAWAWGASRAVDAFENDQAVDAAQVGIAGHSRYGKAALVAMAYDPRFVVAYISSSGAGSAALLRRRFGEQIENLAGVGEYHWFGGAFLKYAGKLTPKNLPVDAHDLFALAAPRPVFVSAGANGDDWVDPKGMFMAEAAATPVYRLLGKTGMDVTAMPPPGTAADSGELAFRQHSEGHTMAPNWPYFLRFASRFIHAAR